MFSYDDVLKAALLGTAHEPLSPELVAHSKSAFGLEQATPEAALLLLAASSALVDRVNYGLGYCPLPLPTACSPDDTILCGGRSMRHLRQMLSGTHSFALPEWLIAVAHAGQRTSADVLPKLLQRGHNKPHLRPFMLPVIGERGLWLAREINNQNWKWVLEPMPYSLEDTLTLESWQDMELIRQAAAGSLEDFITGLQDYRFVWSVQLTEAFLQRLEAENLKTSPHPSLGNVLRRIGGFAYYFPLAHGQTILQRIENAPIVRATYRSLANNYQTAQIENMSNVMNFRKEMLDAIATRED